MNILIAQPKFEKGIKQLIQEIEMNPTADLIIFPEGYLKDQVEYACELARKYRK